jgi:hypothetical protein
MSEFIHETIQLVEPLQRILLLAPTYCLQQRRCGR